MGVIAGYNSRPYCCGTLYAVFLATMRKNPECVTKENPEGWQFFCFENTCDAECHRDFVTLVTALKHQYSLNMELIDFTGLTQEELVERFKGPIERANAECLGLDVTALPGKKELSLGNIDFGFMNGQTH